MFEENRAWSWDESYEEQVLVYLEWGNDNDKEAASKENLKVTEELENISPISRDENMSSSSGEERVRRTP